MTGGSSAGHAPGGEGSGEQAPRPGEQERGAQALAPLVLRGDDARVTSLLAAGWRCTERSWAAQLNAEDMDREALAGFVRRVTGHAEAAGAADAAGRVTIRELGASDVDAALRLDAETAGDYPGGAATRHAPLTRATAMPAPSRRAFGVFAADGALLAMSYLDVDAVRGHAETDFTVVHAGHRGRGLGTAVKAASVLALADAGAVRFRTGGSSRNGAIFAVNRALGYVRDEEWLTLIAPVPEAEAPGR